MINTNICYMFLTFRAEAQHKKDGTKRIVIALTHTREAEINPPLALVRQKGAAQR